MANVNVLEASATTTGTTDFTTGAFTPTAGALVVAVFAIAASTTFDNARVSSSLGEKFHRPESMPRFNANASFMSPFVAHSPAVEDSQTIAINLSDAGTSAAWCVFEIVDIERFGAEAIRQLGIHNNQGAGGTPSVNPGADCLTTNVIMFAVANVSNPAGVTEPANFTEIADVGAATDNVGLEVAVRESGHTTENVTAGSTSATAFCGFFLEFDCTTTQTVKPVGSGTTPATTGIGTGGASCDPDYPDNSAPLAEGDLIVAALGIKPSTATAPADPDGSGNWDLIVEGTGGTGSQGTDTGPSKVAWYEFNPDGDNSGVGSSPPSGQATFTPGSSPNACWSQMFAFRAPYGQHTLWDLAGAVGDDATGGATYTAAMGSDPGIDADDIIMVAGCTATDVNLPANVRKYSDIVITGTGLATGQSATDGATSTEPSSTEGQDIGGLTARFAPTAGLSSGVPTFTATAGGTTTNVHGPIAMLRIRAIDNTPAPGGATQQTLMMTGMGS